MRITNLWIYSLIFSDSRRFVLMFGIIIGVVVSLLMLALWRYPWIINFKRNRKKNTLQDIAEHTFGMESRPRQPVKRKLFGKCLPHAGAPSSDDILFS